MTEKLRRLAVDDEKRIKVQFIGVFAALGLVALAMSAADAITKTPPGEMLPTLVFGVLMLLNVVLMRVLPRKKALYVTGTLCSIEIAAIVTYFLIMGTHEGVSVLWMLLIPSCGLFLFGKKRGTALNALLFLGLVFLCWTPWGRGLLQYDYSGAFLFRFPILFAAFYLVGLLLESILEVTFGNFRRYYRYDELTDVLTRRGFHEYVDRTVEESSSEKVAFLIFDLDYFKDVNDRFGHPAGDEVLKLSAETIQELLGLPLCRLGGEEFAAFDPEGRFTQADLEAVCRKFTEKEITVKGETIDLTVSAGGAVLRKEGTGEELLGRLMEEADAALYRAKKNGRNCAELTDLTR